jgi:hypothetical protein
VEVICPDRSRKIAIATNMNDFFISIARTLCLSERIELPPFVYEKSSFENIVAEFTPHFKKIIAPAIDLKYGFTALLRGKSGF